MLNSKQNVQECDATGGDSSSEADNKNSLKLIYTNVDE